jgi:hypothetical protein
MDRPRVDVNRTFEWFPAIVSWEDCHTEADFRIDWKSATLEDYKRFKESSFRIRYQSNTCNENYHEDFTVCMLKRPGPLQPIMQCNESTNIIFLKRYARV